VSPQQFSGLLIIFVIVRASRHKFRAAGPGSPSQRPGLRVVKVSALPASGPPGPGRRVVVKGIFNAATICILCIDYTSFPINVRHYKYSLNYVETISSICILCIVHTFPINVRHYKYSLDFVETINSICLSGKNMQTSTAW
jgi:hypothetical protein